MLNDVLDLVRSHGVDAVVAALQRAVIFGRFGSDDLLAVTEGTLPFTTAWSSGRLRIEASMLDMLRLRAIL